GQPAQGGRRGRGQRGGNRREEPARAGAGQASPRGTIGLDIPAARGGRGGGGARSGVPRLLRGGRRPQPGAGPALPPARASPATHPAPAPPPTSAPTPPSPPSGAHTPPPSKTPGKAPLERTAPRHPSHSVGSPAGTAAPPALAIRSEPGFLAEVTIRSGVPLA